MNSPVSSIDVTFNEPILTSNFNSSALVLTDYASLTAGERPEQ